MGLKYISDKKIHNQELKKHKELNWSQLIREDVRKTIIDAGRAHQCLHNHKIQDTNEKHLIACGHRPFTVRFIRTAVRNTMCLVSAADPNSRQV